MAVNSSGAHRVANGNSLVCAGPQGWLCEVTPDQRIVWDYRIPYSGDATMGRPDDVMVERLWRSLKY